MAYTIVMKARYEMPGGDFLGIIFSMTVLCMSIGGASIMQPNSKWAFPAFVIGWVWATCSWATMVKAVQENLASVSLYPMTSFWVAFFPQMISAVLFLMFYAALAGWSGMHMLKTRESGVRDSAWYYGGAASMFGQLFSVMALGTAAPALVFVIQSSQTLLGSLLGVSGLAKGWNLYFLGAVAASCAAIALTSFAALPEASWLFADNVITIRTDQLVGSTGLVFVLVCGLCACLGGTAQACAVKRGYSMYEFCGPIEALRNMCVAGAGLGGLVLLIWCTAHSALNSYLPPHKPAAGGLSELGSTMSELSAHSGFWFLLTMYHFFQQIFSVLLLNIVDVADHQQVAGCMYAFAAIYVSWTINVSLTPLVVIGVALAGLALYCFISNPSSESGMEKLRVTGLPVTMRVIAGFLVILGCVSPMALKFGLAHQGNPASPLDGKMLPGAF